LQESQITHMKLQGELWSMKQNSQAIKSNSENSSHKRYRQVLACISAWQPPPSVLKKFHT